jgi:hypothetical protein
LTHSRLVPEQGDGMDAEQTIAEIERLEHVFTEPETRPLRRWIAQGGHWPNESWPESGGRSSLSQFSASFDFRF